MNWRTGTALAILAFIGGALAISWLSSSGLLPWSEHAQPQNEATTALPDRAPPIANPMAAAPLAPQIIQPIADSARTEAMLAIMAARRALGAGLPLGDVAARLQASFAASQPQALAQVIDADREQLNPTALLAEFDVLAPQLGRAPVMSWEGVQRELASLFVLRRSDKTPENIDGQVQRARDYLAVGNVEAAVRFVEALPGTANAKPWLAKARRYLQTQRALDQLEAAALTRPMAPAPIAAPTQIPENAAPQSIGQPEPQSGMQPGPMP